MKSLCIWRKGEERCWTMSSSRAHYTLLTHAHSKVHYNWRKSYHQSIWVHLEGRIPVSGKVNEWMGKCEWRKQVASTQLTTYTCSSSKLRNRGTRNLSDLILGHFSVFSQVLEMVNVAGKKHFKNTTTVHL